MGELTHFGFAFLGETFSFIYGYVKMFLFISVEFPTHFVLFIYVVFAEYYERSSFSQPWSLYAVFFSCGF